MDANSFGAFQQQVTRNQDELKDYLVDLDSWKDSISKKDNTLREGVDTTPETNNYPPIRNSLHKKKKIKRKKSSKHVEEDIRKKPDRIPGHDFQAWDKFDVDKALEDIENNTTSDSSYEEDTDEEWEEERMKQRALFEKDQGNDYYKKNMYSEAIECYTKGITCDPTSAVIYANRAMALLKQEKYGAAEKDCTDAIVLDPTYIKAYMRRGTARQKLKKYESALDDYRQIVKLEPDNKMALREVASLEQELRISADGIVIPIKKSLKERSKKPLVRVEIQEIDQDDVKSKLDAAVTKTTALQSEEKKRILAQDNESFNKYMNNRTTTCEPSQHSSAAVAMDRTTKIKQHFVSPSDIGNLHLTRDEATSHDVTINGLSGSKQQSPKTSPRAPINCYQFQRDWKTIKDDIDKAYEYLKVIPAEQLPKLIGEFLEADVMTTILSTFQHRFLRDRINICDHMMYLAKVKRFSMVVMFMSNTDKQMTKMIIAELFAMEGVIHKDVEKLHQLYQV